MSEPLKLQPTPPASTQPAAATTAPTAPAAQSLPASAKELRRQRARRMAMRFGLGVGIPTLIAIIYSLFLAKPQYDSHAVLEVESVEAHSDVTRAHDSNAGNQRDAKMLKEKFQSRAMLDKLLALGFAEHYRGGDWISGLDDDAGTEETFDYFRKKVAVTGEGSSNVLHIRVRAFAPAKAQEFAQAIVSSATTWIDELSTRAAKELIEPAEAELVRAKAALAAAPPEPGNVERVVADRQVEAAVQGLQEARLDAAAARRRVNVIAEPSLATDASRPRPAWDIATVLVTSAVLVSVLSLLGAAVREHANF
jgi:capsule polysaccharide export protein KpsE/RkpR